MTVEARMAVLENELKHLRSDHEEVKAVALGTQRMMRWAMGAAASFGAILPVVLPKLLKAIGL